MNRKEDSEINPHSYSQLNFNRGTKNIRWRKGILFNSFVGKTCRRLKIGSYPSTCRKMNSKDLNVRPETFKLIEQNT
jgi:hypothetical protein